VARLRGQMADRVGVARWIAVAPPSGESVRMAWEGAGRPVNIVATAVMARNRAEGG
jgi:hypothetical protein